MAPISFRNSKIIYYGPHGCPNCGAQIVRMGNEFGGNAFNNPEGPIYPNTEWFPHVCDPALVKKQLASEAKARVQTDWPSARAEKIGELGFVIMGEPECPDKDSGAHRLALVISPCSTFYDTEDAAWEGALQRPKKMWPTWHLDRARHNENSRFTDDLDRLPECPAA